MAPRITFIICSIITFIIAAAIYIVPEFFTMKAFLKAKGNEVEIGITMHYLLAGGILHVCLLLFAASKLDGANIQNRLCCVQRLVLLFPVPQRYTPQIFVTLVKLYRR